MTKLIMALGGAGLAALATVLAVALAGSGQPTTSVGTLPAPAATLTSTVATTTEAGEDVSGPCDEAEHAGDPRCTGATAQQTQVGDDGSNHDVGDDHGDHEAEASDEHGRHTNDDRGGHGGGGGDDDRSGSSSGRG